MRRAEEVIAQDKKRLVVDAFARWRIVDPLRFYQSLYRRGRQRTMRLTPILSSNVRRVLGSQNFAAVLSGKRAAADAATSATTMNQRCRWLRHQDRRCPHPPAPICRRQNSEAIYQRMQKERKREANEYRAEGEEISQRIRARAEREVTVLIAEATRESEILRGQGDAEKTTHPGATPSARIPTSSPSTARCRPIRTRSPATTRRWSCRPTANSSAISDQPAATRSGNSSLQARKLHCRITAKSCAIALFASYSTAHIL